MTGLEDLYIGHGVSTADTASCTTGANQVYSTPSETLIVHVAQVVGICKMKKTHNSQFTRAWCEVVSSKTVNEESVSVHNRFILWMHIFAFWFQNTSRHFNFVVAIFEFMTTENISIKKCFYLFFLWLRLKGRISTTKNILHTA